VPLHYAALLAGQQVEQSQEPVVFLGGLRYVKVVVSRDRPTASDGPEGLFASTLRLTAGKAVRDLIQPAPK
jgi:hypothetical protein